MQVIGYVDRRTGQIICLGHGVRDIQSRYSPWAAVRLLEPRQAGYSATTPVICHECGSWLNDESTGYAIVAMQDNSWRGRLRWTRGHRDRDRIP